MSLAARSETAAKPAPTKMHYLDFEKEVAELESKIEELRQIVADDDLLDEIVKIQRKAERKLQQLYAKLSPWQKLQIARHPERPQFSDFIGALTKDFIPLGGDRLSGEDTAMVGGIARFNGYSCMFIGNEKGRTTAERMHHNFGMAKPQGYRKAARLMKLADRFLLPVITFVDTPGAYPGVEAEERGQASAIADSIATCLDINVPIITVITGEGGSGGALAIAVADNLLMLEHAVYSLISPEGCASILWRSTDKAIDAAESLRITAKDLVALGVVDEVIAEPIGGAHRNPEKTFEAVEEALAATLELVSEQHPASVRERRLDRYLRFRQD